MLTDLTPGKIQFLFLARPTNEMGDLHLKCSQLFPQLQLQKCNTAIHVRCTKAPAELAFRYFLQI